MSDDRDRRPISCGACNGAGGEWVDTNGTQDGARATRQWVRCDACDGSGRV